MEMETSTALTAVLLVLLVVVDVLVDVGVDDDAGVAMPGRDRQLLKPSS